MGNKDSFPGVPRGDVGDDFDDATEFRERQVLGAQAARGKQDQPEDLTDELAACELALDERTFAKNVSAQEIARQLVKALIDDLDASRFDDVAVALIAAFEQEMFIQVAKNPP